MVLATCNLNQRFLLTAPHFARIALASIEQPDIRVSTDKGKTAERRRRKVSGLRARPRTAGLPEKRLTSTVELLTLRRYPVLVPDLDTAIP